MNLQIASLCFQTYKFCGPVTGKSSRTLHFREETILTNVHVLCTFYENNVFTQWGTLTSQQTRFNGTVRIAGHPNPQDPRNGFIFEIGDPKRDADVEISEE